jgi:uncharacterized protein (DUF433 family)
MAEATAAQLASRARLANYTFAEAARYVRMPASTVRYWAKGGSVTNAERRIHFEQVLAGPPRQALTFLDLTELLVVRELRETFNLNLRTIRRAKAYVEDAFDRPWYLYELAVHGPDIFIEHIEAAPIAATRSGQLALAGFLDELLVRVRADDHGVPTDIFPRLAESSEPCPIRISPVVSFGSPTIRDTGIRTSTVASRYDAGEDIGDIARDYGISQELIADAIRFQVAAA